MLTWFCACILGINDADWEITGDGNYPFALTDMADIGRYTARAAILAHNEPNKVPSRLRVYGESKYVCRRDLVFLKKYNLLIIFLYRTFNEYADIHEKITGQKVNKIYVPREQVLEKWNSGKEGPYYVLRVAADSPAQNFVGRDHNELLNPGQKYFKPKTWEEIVSA